MIQVSFYCLAAIFFSIGMAECTFVRDKAYPPLIPSQVLFRNKQTKSFSCVHNRKLIPSQVTVIANVPSHHESDNVDVSTRGPLMSSSEKSQDATPPQQKRKPSKRRSHSNQITSADLNATFSSNRHDIGGSQGKPNRRNLQPGRIPNIFWYGKCLHGRQIISRTFIKPKTSMDELTFLFRRRGVVPMDHLRQHPLFVPLPLAAEIRHLECLEDVRYFRQGSWQWDALHSGRCTTSQLASALGFLNPKAAEFLGIPRSMRSLTGGMSAYRRLSQQALSTLDEMNAVLCDATKQRINNNNNNNNTDQQGLWVASSKLHDSLPFHARYQPNTTATISVEKRHLLERLVKTGVLNGASVRMMWGDAQESTALLTALNYFARKEPGVIMKEVGMCGAGLDWNTTNGQALLIGASPDALLCYPDGRTEVLEVKNHCPFFSTTPPFARNANAKDCRFSIRSMPLNDAKARSVPPQYLPQLMMEMLCVGPECTSAVMVRQTAINGAIILRLHRNNDWIDEMLFWLQRFQNDFVQQNTPPTTNFFWLDDSHCYHNEGRYKQFLQKTVELCLQVEVVAQIPNNLVQRDTSPTSRSMFLD